MADANSLMGIKFIYIQTKYWAPQEKGLVDKWWLKGYSHIIEHFIYQLVNISDYFLYLFFFILVQC